MHLTTIDWVIMASFFAVSLGIGIGVSRKSGRDFSSFFLGSRQLPWWLLGVSMVATTFSTDTPNLVADIVRSDGAVGNWIWWAFLLTGMLTVFVYAKLWRRSGVLTDVEFYELRYSGKLAAFLRFFRAAYLGILFNIFIMASVTLAAIKIGSVLMDWTPIQTVVIAASVTMVYSALGGLRGVVLTDIVQFTLAMIGSIAAAIYVINLPEVGGLSELFAHPNVSGSLNFLPNLAEMTWQELLPAFIIPITVQWWAAYYPGAEPGGGGYIAQRMLSAKNEKHAVGATLTFNVMHYALRPWPWILVALASLVVFPDLNAIATKFPHISSDIVKNDLAYPAMLTYLPAGLLGLVVTSLAAAYMSTMSTQVNWGSSVVVNDLYQRFFNQDATQRQLVWAGRICTVVLMIIACALALILQNALQVFGIIIQIGAGTGLIFILRWFWWRVNAASELTAMIVSFVAAIALSTDAASGFEAWEKLVIGVGITTVSWIAVAFLTRPTDDEKLVSFFNKIRPGGPGWNSVRQRANAAGIQTAQPDTDLPAAILATVFGALGVYSALFATGFMLYGRFFMGGGCMLVALVSLYVLVRVWPHLSFE